MSTPFIERIAFTDPAFADAMLVRKEVFVEEQNCDEENEQDEFDTHAFHFVVYASVGSITNSNSRTPVGTIRLIPPIYAKHTYALIGRLAVLKPFRGLGLAKLLVDEALKYAVEEGTETFDVPENGVGWDGKVLAHAQVDVKRFYEKMGFVWDESMGQWDEEGIPHIGMWKQVRGERRRSSVMIGIGMSGRRSSGQ